MHGATPTAESVGRKALNPACCAVAYDYTCSLSCFLSMMDRWHGRLAAAPLLDQGRLNCLLCLLISGCFFLHPPLIFCICLSLSFSAHLGLFRNLVPRSGPRCSNNYGCSQAWSTAHESGHREDLLKSAEELICVIASTTFDLFSNYRSLLKDAVRNLRSSAQFVVRRYNGVWKKDRY
jgi:hypothetical protein